MNQFLTRLAELTDEADLLCSPRLVGQSAEATLQCLVSARCSSLGPSLFRLAPGAAAFSLAFHGLRLSVVYRTDAIGEICQKQVGVVQLYLGWDAAHAPVLDPLRTAINESELMGELRRAAKAIDDLAVWVHAMFAHGYIKHHVYQKCKHRV